MPAIRLNPLRFERVARGFVFARTENYRGGAEVGHESERRGTKTSLGVGEKGNEACLVEVGIGGEGIGDALILHDREGGAIDEAPCLIRAGGVEFRGLVEERLGGGNEVDGGTGSHRGQEAVEERAVGGAER